MGCNVKNDTSVRENIIKALNEELGKDINAIGSLKNQLEEKKEKIEKCLSLMGSDVPSKVSRVVKNVEKTSEEIQLQSKNYNDLNESSTTYLKKIEKVKKEAAIYVNKIDLLEKACGYLRLIQGIEEICNTIEAGINEKNERKQVMNYLLLSDYCKLLTGTKCKHLLTFLNETLHYWHNILKERFTADYDEVLKVLKWPFVANTVLGVPTVETLNQFQILTENLIQIQLDQHDFVTSSLVIDFPPLSLPMSQLVKPLRKRFMFHFTGSRQTNRVDKPEWFFTQVLTWIREHQDFVEKNVQPAYDKFPQTQNKIAKIELMRGLIEIVVEKLHNELPNLHYDDALFSHCVDEALGFDKELRNSYGYPDSQPSVIYVLTQAQIFVKWINMEKRYSQEKMDKILISETAFNPLVSGDEDENHVTECADCFLTLLSTITERYEVLAQPGHKLQFLQLQLELIDDFRVRLLQMLQGEDTEPLSSKFPNILNTVNYIRNVLEEWGQNTFFLQLKFFKSKLDGQEDSVGTVFDEYVSLLGKMRDTLVEELTDHVFMDVKAKSMAYRKDKWHAMESPKNFIKPVITETACNMFQVLITRLHQLQELLAHSLFKQTWSLLASKIDQFLFEEMVAICLFNEGGALQFCYDINKNLFPLFGQYSSKPETHFRLLKDSCVILSMSKGMAMSLRETIKAQRDEEFDIVEILNDVGIYSLQKNEVLDLLSRRTDLCL